jgi:Holliday junction resolvase RusA-like endonuclease
MAANRSRGIFREPVRGQYLQPAAVSIQFALPRPKSAPAYVEATTKYPDLDKLLRVILDELTLWILTDDRQIVELHSTKVYADPDANEPTGAIVRVWPCSPPEKERWT